MHQFLDLKYFLLIYSGRYMNLQMQIGHLLFEMFHNLCMFNFPFSHIYLFAVDHNPTEIIQKSVKCQTFKMLR